MILVDLVEAFCEINGNAAINSLHLATQIWSMIHSVAILGASQLINLFDRSIEPETFLNNSVRTLLAGVGGRHCGELTVWRNQVSFVDSPLIFYVVVPAPATFTVHLGIEFIATTVARCNRSSFWLCIQIGVLMPSSAGAI